MDALFGGLLVVGLPLLTFWWGSWRGYRRAVRKLNTNPLVCQCGGAWAFHDRTTGRCSHQIVGHVINGVREVRVCTCQHFVDALYPYSEPPQAAPASGS
jgi:hypothetical protein